MGKYVRASVLASFGLLAAASGAMAECGAIAGALRGVAGYDVAVPPAGPAGGWCVMDGASFRSERSGWPDLVAERLRLRETASEVEVDLQGLRATPRASDREVDDRIRAMLRFQSADLRLLARHDAEAEILTLSGLRLDLSGGAALGLDAEVTGAGLSPASLAGGSVTQATLVWRNDGRLLRPVMDLAGERMAGSGGEAAVEATRSALATLVEALPDPALDDASRTALEAAVRALPQGRGKLTLTFASADGIGVGKLAGLALSGNPTSPEALAAFLAGARITADWQPGLAP